MFEFLLVIAEDVRPGDIIDDHSVVSVQAIDDPNSYDRVHVVTFDDGVPLVIWDDEVFGIQRPLTPAQEVALAALVAAN